MPRAALVEHPLDAVAVVAEVQRSANGALVLFVGTVRDEHRGRAVTGIEYSAYGSMAISELTRIVTEASERFGTPDIVCEHRIGVLRVNEASVVIGVGHPRRAQAYEASRWVIEALKASVPIWKREHYADGTREWVHHGQ
jgi:molybdopterin synthase catalytic subunit